MKKPTTKKRARPYDCVAVLDDTGGQFVNFTIEFVEKKKQSKKKQRK